MSPSTTRSLLALSLTLLAPPATLAAGCASGGTASSDGPTLSEGQAPLPKKAEDAARRLLQLAQADRPIDLVPYIDSEFMARAKVELSYAFGGTAAELVDILSKVPELCQPRYDTEDGRTTIDVVGEAAGDLSDSSERIEKAQGRLERATEITLTCFETTVTQDTGHDGAPVEARQTIEDRIITISMAPSRQAGWRVLGWRKPVVSE